MKFIYQLVPLFVAALHVSAHGVITNVSGANGVAGQAFGVVATTPRTGSKRDPFQQDSSIIRDREISSGKAGVCGRTLGGGNNDVQAMLAAASSAGLPSVAADGSVQMTLHQVNGDGAGPYSCQVSADATGQNFVTMDVTQQVPGIASISLAKATPFPLVAQMPAGMTCTGGPTGDACIVRCRNVAIAGPFGGCVAVTNANGGNATAAAAGTAAGVAGTGVVAGTAAGTAASGVAGTGVGAGAPGAAGTAATGVAGTAAATGAAGASIANANGAAAAAKVGAGGTGIGAGVGSVVGSLLSKAGDAAGPLADVAGLAGIARALTKSQKQQQVSDVEDINDISIEEAEAALAKDLDRRQRVRRSRIVGRLAL
ncbi:hypothetical protein PC9H_000070 [Pleurotus ostreatus]|uniref:GEgh 16 protein n=1 Tax=Pleurotus ostreatus TaxID=5322 RepID=A0A8H7A2U9_PLEOS|nr:uncharacterized protein PC9H_000070 [Pleurotus ostreatus]KAF7439734.1 hypothetical protein PC9H_000070 [Pleurotus ostreatus]KAJ8701113.1 hypothetical protein PTI98_004070 [Pleurotus ostreatus]